jgi:hypothetical protein
LQFLIFGDENTLTVDSRELKVAVGIIPGCSIGIEIESCLEIFMLHWIETLEMHQAQIEIGCGDTLGS